MLSNALHCSKYIVDHLQVHIAGILFLNEHCVNDDTWHTATQIGQPGQTFESIKICTVSYRLCHCVLWRYGFCVAMCCVGKDCVKLSLNHALDLYYLYIRTLTEYEAGYGSKVHYISGILQPRFTKRQASSSIQSKLMRYQLGLGSQIW